MTHSALGGISQIPAPTPAPIRLANSSSRYTRPIKLVRANPGRSRSTALAYGLTLTRLSQLEVWTLDKSLKINATIKKVCTKLAISTQAASG